MYGADESQPKRKERHRQNRKLVKDAAEAGRERMKSIEHALAELDRRNLDYKKKCSVYEPYRTAASPAVESESKSEEIRCRRPYMRKRHGLRQLPQNVHAGAGFGKAAAKLL